jgi:DNA-binding LacI/PurR family transcriptional regulator
MANIKDVAKEAGVSVMTASRVARNLPNVSEKTRKKVQDVMDRLSYQPDQLAQALRTRTTNTIGIVVSDVENAFYMQVIACMEKYLKERGYSLFISFSNENDQEEYTSMNMLLAAKVAGLIVTPVRREDELFKQLLRRYDVPVLQLYRNVYPSVESLVFDDEYGIYMATKRLLEAGHRDILLFDVDWKGRADGYRKAFVEKGIPLRDDMIMTCRLTSSDESHIMGAIERLHPTALIAGTNLLGHDAVSACIRIGLKIPHDFSLVIPDDVSWVSLLNITAIRQPMESTALEAVDLILDRILLTRAGDKPNRSPDALHHVIRPDLLERGSIQKIDS